MEILMTNEELFNIFIKYVPKSYEHVIPHLTIEYSELFLRADGELVNDPGLAILYKGIPICDVGDDDFTEFDIYRYFEDYFKKDIELVEMYSSPLYKALTNGNTVKSIDNE
jgi:hypothetical protein